MERPASPLRWFFLPPVVAVPTILAVRYLGSPLDSGPVDASLWGLAGLLFLVLTVLYVLLILQGARAGFIPVQLIAQGMLLCPLSLHLGARMLQWVGVTLVVCGAVVLVAIYYYRLGGAGLPEESKTDVQGADLPIPFAVTGPTGHILSVSDALLEIAGVSREVALASDITVFLTPGEETATLGGKVWNVSQQPMKDERFYFQIEPKTFADVPPAPRPADPFIDPPTGLYTQDYAMRRLEEELYRVRRYDHSLSAALIRFVFVSTSGAEAEKKAFCAWCHLVRETLRASDIAFLFGPQDVFLILPETDGDAAEAVVTKLEALIPTLRMEHPALSSVTLLRLTASVKSGPGVPSADELVRRVEEGLRAKYTLNS